MENKNPNLIDNPWIRAIIFAGFIAIFLILCGFLRGILISLFLAFTVAYIFDPVVDFIETRKRIFPKIKLRRSPAICILIFGITLFTGALLVYAIPKTINGFQQVGNTIKLRFPEYRLNIKNLIEQYGDNEISEFFRNKLGISNNDTDMPVKSDFFANQPQIAIDNQANASKADNSIVKKHLLKPLVNLKKYTPDVLKFVSNIAKEIFKSTFGIIGIIINFFIFTVVTVYLLKDFDMITTQVKELIPNSRRDKTAEIFLKIDDNLKGFFRGQITVCLMLSFIYSIGITIAGVPLSFILGFIAGFGNVIPYFGTIVGLGLTEVITFYQFHDIHHMLFVGLVFGLGQFLEGTLITPRIIGNKLGLSPVIVIISILIWSQLLGFLGLLLAVPITSAAKVLIDEGLVKYRSSDIYKKK